MSKNQKEEITDTFNTKELGEYITACQKVMAWYAVYFKLFEELNPPQNAVIRLETCKEVGVDIDQLKEEHNQLSKQLQPDEDKENGKTNT
tara:strand:+ start:3716 stop:3985 length:270 start_codon:yes stop_codon:yes gene_type:complete